LTGKLVAFGVQENASETGKEGGKTRLRVPVVNAWSWKEEVQQRVNRPIRQKLQERKIMQ
jgi:hypothetical protein